MISFYMKIENFKTTKLLFIDPPIMMLIYYFFPFTDQYLLMYAGLVC